MRTDWRKDRLFATIEPVSPKKEMPAFHVYGIGDDMGFTFEEKEKNHSKYAAITGYEGTTRVLYISEEIAGLPVRSIAPHAFAGRKDIEDVYVPERVDAIGAYAFHNAEHLRRLHLTDHITDLYDGAIRQCNELSEIEITFSKPDSFRLLKDLLGDTDAHVPVLLHCPFENNRDGDSVRSERCDLSAGSHMVSAALSFPSFADNYQEDTMARALHEKIDGSGYEARQVVSRTAIDFRHYDTLFQRFTYDEPATAVDCAFRRLLYPYQLEPAAEERYRTYIKEKSAEILPMMIRGDREDLFDDKGNIRYIPISTAETEHRIRFMASEKLIEDTAKEPTNQALAEAPNPVISAILLNHWQENGNNTETFDLDAL